MGRPRHLRYLSDKAAGLLDGASKEWKKPYEVIAAVGMAPGESDASDYALVEGDYKPLVGDIIAFQEMSLNEETCQVELTPYKYGRIYEFTPESNTVKASTACSLNLLNGKGVSKLPPKELKSLEVQNLANIRLVEGPTQKNKAPSLPPFEGVDNTEQSDKSPELGSDVGGLLSKVPHVENAESSDFVAIETTFNPCAGDEIIFQIVNLCLETFQPVQSDDKFALVISSGDSVARIQLFETLKDLRDRNSRTNAEEAEVNFDYFFNVRLISGPSRDEHDERSAALAKVNENPPLGSGEDLFELLALKKRQLHATK